MIRKTTVGSPLAADLNGSPKCFVVRRERRPYRWPTLPERSVWRSETNLPFRNQSVGSPLAADLNGSPKCVEVRRERRLSSDRRNFVRMSEAA
jgi:hypothetical protein